jgi:hypothetical protein
MPKPLRKAVSARRRERLGDLHGLTYLEVLGSNSPGKSGAMRQLYGLLHIVKAVEDARPAPLFVVPAQARSLALDEVDMQPALHEALRERGVHRLGEIASLTPARLGKDFGANLWKGLEALLGRLVMLPPPGRAAQATFAHAIDVAMAGLPAVRRRALGLRFGARGRPVPIRIIATRCGLNVVDPHRKLDYWTRALGRDAGPLVRRAIHVVRALAGERRSRLTSDEVDAALGITRSRPHHGRDFYLRLLRRLDPSVKFDVAWGKRLGSRRPES